MFGNGDPDDVVFGCIWFGEVAFDVSAIKRSRVLMLVVCWASQKLIRMHFLAHGLW